MVKSLIEFTEQWIQGSPWLAVGAVFLGGLATAANPCSLASVPVVISLVGGQTAITSWRRGLVTSLIFVAGLAISFSAMAVIAVSAGTYFGSTSPIWPWFIAAVCFLAATQFWDLWHLNLPDWITQIRPGRSGLDAAFGMGLLFGVISAPCAAPVLVIVLTHVASKADYAYGLLLLWVYAVGHCALVVAAGASVSAVRWLVASERYAQANLVVRRSAGVLIGLVGVYLIYKQFQTGM